MDDLKATLGQMRKDRMVFIKALRDAGLATLTDVSASAAFHGDVLYFPETERLRQPRLSVLLRGDGLVWYALGKLHRELPPDHAMLPSLHMWRSFDVHSRVILRRFLCAVRSKLQRQFSLDDIECLTGDPDGVCLRLAVEDGNRLVERLREGKEPGRDDLADILQWREAAMLLGDLSPIDKAMDPRLASTYHIVTCVGLLRYTFPFRHRLKWWHAFRGATQALADTMDGLPRTLMRGLDEDAT